MTKEKRRQIYDKYGCKCAYCGKVIELKDMQVDHIIPKRLCSSTGKSDNMKNLNPSCRRCNHYKRAKSVDYFKQLIKTLHIRVQDMYICKVAEDYGIIKVEAWDGVFYFEKVGGEKE